jgi:hypothetical protein
MALVKTIGTVIDIQVNQATQGDQFTWAGFTLKDNSNQIEYFMLWQGTAYGSPPGTAQDWMIRSMSLSLLREALAQKLTVSIFHEDTSSIAGLVELGTMGGVTV